MRVTQHVRQGPPSGDAEQEDSTPGPAPDPAELGPSVQAPERLLVNEGTRSGMWEASIRVTVLPSHVRGPQTREPGIPRVPRGRA